MVAQKSGGFFDLGEMPASEKTGVREETHPLWVSLDRRR